MDIEPFRIDIPQIEIDALRERIAKTRLPGAMEGVGWAYGMEDSYLQSLLAAWQAFDWREEEARLNRLPHFTATVDGERIHFIHQRSASPSAVPLVLTHGYPSSFVEWLAVVDTLRASGFHVVIPSLPGYGFSGIPGRPGMTPRRIAGLWAGLMSGLGYERFGAAGCDWGNSVSSFLGLDHPGRVAGLHIGGASLSHAERPAKKTAAMESYGKARKLWRERETGYIEIQSTKPQTLAYGLTDSPAGLAAWIAEKFRAWSEHDGDPRQAVPQNVLLSNISIYWFTRTINSAMRLYYENRWSPFYLAAGQRIEPPCAFYVERSRGTRGESADVRQFTPRAGQAPRESAEAAYNVVRWTQAPRGGHFPAIETPELWADDVREFFLNL